MTLKHTRKFFSFMDRAKDIMQCLISEIQRRKFLNDTSELEQRIEDLEVAMVTVQDDVTELERDMTLVDGRLLNLETDVSLLNQNIINIQTDVSRNEAAIFGNSIVTFGNQPIILQHLPGFCCPNAL